MLTILLLEDHAPTAHWLAAIAQDAFPETDIIRADTLAAARNHLQRTLIHLALLDIHLPDGKGIELIAPLRKRNPNALAVMTSIFDNDQHLFDALRTGAQGYLLKEQPEAEQVARLQGILTGDLPLSPGIARRMLAHFHPAQARQASMLSPREKETLMLLAKGYSVKDLIPRLGLSEHAATGYAKTLYRKLYLSSRVETTLAAKRIELVRSA